jgi:hypothetical protein
LNFDVHFGTLVVVKMPPKITPSAQKAPAKKTPATKAPVKKSPATKQSTTKAPVTSQSTVKRPVPAAVQKKKKTDLGAGLKISQNHVEADHPAGPARYGELTQAERAFTLASTFLSGVLAYARLF